MMPPHERYRFPYDAIRRYGQPPHKVAVLHGGPGAPGYMAPVARELGRKRGVLEPLQTGDSINGQINELGDQLALNTVPPITLIGSSWGAVLALFIAAEKEIPLDKLILIGSAVFDSDSSDKIEKTRLGRLSDHQLDRLHKIDRILGNPDDKDFDKAVKEWGNLFFRTDVYDPVSTDLEVIEIQYDINSKVWPEFTALRDKPNYLRRRFSSIDVPTVVIHGDYDPHPIEGIRPFLEDCINDIRFHMLFRCGHYPWIERYARDEFFEILDSEITS